MGEACAFSGVLLQVSHFCSPPSGGRRSCAFSLGRTSTQQGGGNTARDSEAIARQRSQLALGNYNDSCEQIAKSLAVILIASPETFSCNTVFESVHYAYELGTPMLARCCETLASKHGWPHAR